MWCLVLPAELTKTEIAENGEVFRYFLGMLDPATFRRTIVDLKMTECKNTCRNISNSPTKLQFRSVKNYQCQRNKTRLGVEVLASPFTFYVFSLHAFP